MTLDNLPAPRPPFNPTDPDHSTKLAEQDELKPNEVRLSDGRKVAVRRPKGRDIRDASRLVSGDNAMELSMAMASLAASIDGKPIVYDDFLDWDLADCNKVVAKYGELSGN